ncbi:MAG: hypothetical protein ACREHD_02210, partial [Pirellulales bacterium]
MSWNDIHAVLLSNAFKKVLGAADQGAMAFVRCLPPEVIEALAADRHFSPGDWQCFRVAEECIPSKRTITADQAVEIREGKNDAVLLMVDTALAGAGMDGIYSAAREIDEQSLFREALSLAKREVTNSLGRPARDYAEQAVKKAQGFGKLHSISPWTEFDFYVRIAGQRQDPGELLWVLGLWPVCSEVDVDARDALEVSRLFIDRLLGPALAGQTPGERIESLRLLNPTEDERSGLQRFLRSAATRPLL